MSWYCSIIGVTRPASPFGGAIPVASGSGWPTGRVSAMGTKVSRRQTRHEAKAGRHARLCAGHPRLSFTETPKSRWRASAFEFHAGDALEIAVPDFFLVGGRHINALDDAQRFARVHGPLFGIEGAVGSEHDLVKVVERKAGVCCRHAAEH